MKTLKLLPDLLDKVKAGEKTQTRRPIKLPKGWESIFPSPGESFEFVCEGREPVEVVVVEIRAGLIQDISVDDAIAEGVGDSFFVLMNFKYLWNSIYKERGFGFDQNPWVWVCEFRLKGEE